MMVCPTLQEIYNPWIIVKKLCQSMSPVRKVHYTESLDSLFFNCYPFNLCAMPHLQLLHKSLEMNLVLFFPRDPA